ncbi:MAG: hypothetical protein JWM10_4148 [Myxococcaceae bacterium]|nr:hypothetical protein [Myxococcaceae bacterium]
MTIRMITLHFLHPCESSIFPAEVSDCITGQRCLYALTRAGFIESPPMYYAHGMQNRRTGCSVDLLQPIANEDVRDGDEISISTRYLCS